MFLRSIEIFVNELISKRDYEKVRLVVLEKIRIYELLKRFLVVINFSIIRGVFF